MTKWTFDVTGRGYPLAFECEVTTATDTTHFSSTDMTGWPTNYFKGYYAYPVWDAAGAGGVPQGEYKPISDYVSATGAFTHTVFTAQLALTDKVLIIHPSIANALDVYADWADGGRLDLLLDAVLADTGVIDDVLTPTAAVHFWVDQTAGSDSNGGLSPADPVLTVTYALSLCTTGRYDVIHIMANSPSSPPASETFPIVVDKAGVTIRGEYGKGILSDSGIGSDEQNVATFQIKAHYVTIEDLYLGCDNLGTTGGIVEFNSTNSYFGVTIRRCTFDTQYVPAYGIKIDYDQPYLLVEDCIFGRYDIAGYATAGIYIGNLTAGILRRNTFNACAGIGISAGANAGNFGILDNRFSLPSDTAGKAITLADGSSGIFVDGNKASYGGHAGIMVTNPYVDSNDDNSNIWGVNLRGGRITDPIEDIYAATRGSGVVSLQNIKENQNAELDTARGKYTKTMTGSEDDLYGESSDTEFRLEEFRVDLHNMAVGDTIIFKVYTTEDGTERKISHDESNTFIDAQDPARVEIISSASQVWGREDISITAEQTAGTNREIVCYWRDSKRGS